VSAPGDIGLDRIARVLVRCPTWLGDTVMAVPTLRALRAALPRAESYCVGPWVPSILEAEPSVDHRLPHPVSWRARERQARELRAAAIDLAILLPNSWESALQAWRSGARWRIGYARAARGVLLTHALPEPAGFLHQVAAYLALLQPLGVCWADPVPRLEVLPHRREEARRLLGQVGVRPGALVVGMQCGAAFGQSKLWPVERLAALTALLEARDVQVVFLGTDGVRATVASVAERLGREPRSLVGQDHPAVLPALMAELNLLVSPDSGPAHVAAAVGVPVVTLFGPTDPRLSAPRGDHQVALWRKPPCAPCFRPVCPLDHRCLAELSVDDVADAVWTALAA
jgi:heptosyltransferase-2